MWVVRGTCDAISLRRRVHEGPYGGDSSPMTMLTFPAGRGVACCWCSSFCSRATDTSFLG
jgi:hypothetical protein